MTPKPFHENRYDSIQALRGIASLFIVLEHIRFLNCGAFGVDIFFCISGFMIMLSTHRDDRSFLRKRLRRILPLYYTMTLGTYLMLLLLPGLFERTKSDPVCLIKSLLFIPFDMGGGVLQPLVRIGWTINCEMYFYLLFFVSLHISRRYRGWICSGLLLLTEAAAVLLPDAPVPLRFFGDPVMLEFIFGMVSYELAQRIYAVYQRDSLPLSVSKAAAGGAVFCFAGLLLTKPHVNVLGFYRPLIWGLPAMAIVLCFFTAGLRLSMPAVLTRVGDRSFSLYLLHYYPVQLLDRKVFHFDACTPFTLLGVLVCLAVSLTLSFFGWLLFENGLRSRRRQSF